METVLGYTVVIRLSPFVGVTDTLNTFYATKRQPLLFFNEKCGLERGTQMRFSKVNSQLGRATRRYAESGSAMIPVWRHQPERLGGNPRTAASKVQAPANRIRARRRIK